jgi:predicted PurR-regulated permease PerM
MLPETDRGGSNERTEGDTEEPAADVATITHIEKTLWLVALALLVIGCFLVLQPFLSAILSAIVLCFATWPAYAWLLSHVRSTAIASVAMTMLITGIVLLPFLLIGHSLANDIATVAATMNRLLAEGPPAPPDWVRDLPMVGASLHEYWMGAQSDSATVAADLRPHVTRATNWLLTAGVSLGQGLLEVALSLIIAFFVYCDGRALGRQLSRTTERFIGPRAKSLIDLAGDTTRGVIYGILGTALAQGALAALGFFVAGVPGALFLGFLTFILSFVPMGPPLVWLPAGIWLIATGDYWWGGALLAYGVGVISLVDNFLKPYFISREGKLPFLLVFLGVLGGLLAFGFIGIFIGPVLLALGFSLAREWSTAKAEPKAPAA